MKLPALISLTISLGVCTSPILFAQVINKAEDWKLKAEGPEIASTSLQITAREFPFLTAQQKSTYCELPTMNCNNNQVTGYRLQATGTNQAAEGSNIVSILEDGIDQRVEPTINYEVSTEDYNNTDENLNCYLMMYSGFTEGVEGVLGLEKFRQALVNHPTSTRFTIREEIGNASVQSKESTSSDENINNRENSRIHQALKSALVREHLAEIAEVFLPKNPGAPLTAAKLCEIFDSIAQRRVVLTGRAQGFINYQPSINSIWGESKKRAFREIGNNSITNSMFSYSDMEEPALKRQQVNSAKSLGDLIFTLPPELIFLTLLRSPEKKQASYKAAHEQAVQELQIKYPELTPKIITWKNAIEAWNVITGAQEKESRYEEVVALAADMPLECYRLVALSQAMKIMEDAISYTCYLPQAWEKYQSDPKGKTYQVYFLNKIDTINNNIEKLEKAADAVMRLSEQRDRYFVSLLTVTGEESAIIARAFNDAAMDADKSIAAYCQYSQNMKRGDACAASLFRMSGLSLEYSSLGHEYAAHVYANIDTPEEENFSKASRNADDAARTLEQAVQERSKGAIEIAKVLERAALYCFQVAQAAAHGNSIQETQENILDKTVAFALFAADDAKRAGALEAVKTFERAAQYHFQAVQAAMNGDSTKAENLSETGYDFCYAAKALADAVQARNGGQIEAAKTFERAAQYHFQAAQASLNKNSTKAENLSRTGYNFCCAAVALEESVQAKNEGQGGAAKALEQETQYYFQVAQVSLKGDAVKVENMTKAEEIASQAANSLEHSFYARDDGQGEIATAYELAAQYRFKAAQAALRGDSMKEEIFSKAARYAVFAESPLEAANEARIQGQHEAAMAYEQTAQYYFEAAEATVNGDYAKATNFSKATYSVSAAADALKNAARLRSEGQEEIAVAYEQTAYYYFQAAQSAMNRDSMKKKNFTTAAYKTSYAAESLRKAAQARSEGQENAARAYEQEAHDYFQAAHAVISTPPVTLK